MDPAMASSPSSSSSMSSTITSANAVPSNPTALARRTSAPSPSTSAAAAASSSPCAACKFLRRKCMPGCVFAPYFPPEEPNKFANVHKVFGASNVTKLLNELHPSQREDAVNSLAYEAEARIRDPVYGCAGAVFVLRHQIERLKHDLANANALISRYSAAANLQDVQAVHAPQQFYYPTPARRVAAHVGGVMMNNQPRSMLPQQQPPAIYQLQAPPDAPPAAGMLAPDVVDVLPYYHNPPNVTWIGSSSTGSGFHNYAGHADKMCDDGGAS